MTSQQNSKAQGLIEFALILPLLLVLIFGVIEVGRMIFIYSAASTAAREAARYGSAAGDVGGMVAHYQDCTGIREAAKRIGILTGLQDSDILVRYDQGNNSSIYANCPVGGTGPAAISLGDRVNVQVVAQYRPIVPLVNITDFPIVANSARTIVKDIGVDTGAGGPSGTLSVLSFSVSSQRVSEAAANAVITLQLDEASTQTVSVVLSIAGTSTATEGADFTLSTKSVSIPAGYTAASILLYPVNDGITEGEETVVISMGTPSNATKGTPSTHTVRLVDPPGVSFRTDASTFDEDAGTVGVVVEVGEPSPSDIVVPFTLTGGSAIEGSTGDFTIDASPLTIPAGVTSTSINVAINDDDIDEDDEHITIALGSPTNAVLSSPSEHTLTIADNDDPPRISFVWESQSGTESAGTLVALVELSAPSSKDITAPFSVSGTATRGDDYTISASPLHIPAGQTTAEILIHLIEDGDDTEVDETVIIKLENPVNALLGNPDMHVATISTTETEIPEVFFSASGQTVKEDGISVNVQMKLSGPSSNDVTVPFSMLGSATLGLDYTAPLSPVVIPAGSSYVNLTFKILNDPINEPNELVEAVITSPTNAKVGSPSKHTITILDNDPLPQVTFSLRDQYKEETSTFYSIEVQLTAVSGQDILVPFSLNTISTTATLDSEFTIETASPLYFPPGETKSVITGTLSHEDPPEDEENETIDIDLGTPTNATLGLIRSHTVWIVDNDQPICPSMLRGPVEDYALSFDISHHSPGALETMITKVILYWEPANPLTSLDLLSFGTASIWSGSGYNAQPIDIPSVGSGDWPIANDPARIIHPNEAKTLKFKFSKKINTAYNFVITVYFDNGCSISPLK